MQRRCSRTIARGLRQSWITNRQDLNEAEEANITKGFAWANGRRSLKPDEILTTDFVRALHKQMFGDVWSWAGDFRTGDVNIGSVQAHRIPVDLPVMFDDVRYWVEHQTFLPDEIAVRLITGSWRFIHFRMATAAMRA
jgi:Fic-DOC domain mobile mystery protein B